MITGISLRSCDVADALNPQSGLYTVLVRAGEGISARVVGSIATVLAAPREPVGGGKAHRHHRAAPEVHGPRVDIDQPDQQRVGRQHEDAEQGQREAAAVRVGVDIGGAGHGRTLHSGAAKASPAAPAMPNPAPECPR
jgi:hypothetical protein